MKKTKKLPATINALATKPPAKSRLRTTAPKLSASKAVTDIGLASPPSYKCGGKVNKTGMALVHKGEQVLTKKQQRGKK